MRSKQLNFFVLPDDCIEINLFLVHNRIDAIVQPIYSPDNMLTTDISKKRGKGDFDTVYLTNEEFIQSVKMKYIAEQKYFLVDDFVSLVVEFSRGWFSIKDPNELNRTRLYFVTGYYENGDIIRKNEEFIAWATNFFKAFKKRFLPHKLEGYYLSENALNWMKENNKKISPSGLSIK